MEGNICGLIGGQPNSNVRWVSNSTSGPRAFRTLQFAIFILQADRRGGGEPRDGQLQSEGGWVGALWNETLYKNGTRHLT
jgi:hypothetical protein